MTNTLLILSEGATATVAESVRRIENLTRIAGVNNHPHIILTNAVTGDNLLVSAHDIIVGGADIDFY